MVQLIVTGHAHFASGLLSSVRLITGLDAHFTPIDFTESMSAETLYQQMKEVIDSTTDDILLFTDLPGGTPFNQAVLLKTRATNRTIEVLSGTNLPMLIEASMTHQQAIEQLLPSLIATGKEQVLYYQNKQVQSQVTDSDGI